MDTSKGSFFASADGGTQAAIVAGPGEERLVSSGGVAQTTRTPEPASTRPTTGP